MSLNRSSDLLAAKSAVCSQLMQAGHPPEVWRVYLQATLHAFPLPQPVDRLAVVCQKLMSPPAFDAALRALVASGWLQPSEDGLAVCAVMPKDEGEPPSA